VPGIARTALLDERVQLNAAGQVELKLKPPWRDGTTHLVMTPLEFMRRLAALVLRPTTASRLSILVVRCPHWVDLAHPERRLE
jgi:Putative transposase